MVRRVTSRISSAHVIAVIALFVALGGGAFAFSGSGTLQKAGPTGISSSFEDIRTLNGFGTLQARCDTGDDEMEYQFKNTTSSSVIWVYAANEDGSFVTSGVGLDGTSATFESNGVEESTRVHLWKAAATSKSGVEIVISNDGPFANDCSTADVRVMALNTVE